MHIVVVGGRGVIGSAIAGRLAADGNAVTVVTHSRELAGKPGYRYGDLLRPHTLAAAVEGAEAVVQSANFGSYPFEKRRRGQTFMAFDGAGAEHLVAAAERAGARRFVFVAGAGCRDGGDKPYWTALRRGEEAVLGSSMEGVCVEPTLVFGARDRGLNRMLGLARRTGLVPLVGRGDELHQPVFVEDVAQLVSQAVQVSSPRGVFAIGGPERLTMVELVRRALATAGSRAGIIHVPPPLARFGALLLEKLPGERLTRDGLDFVLEDFIADLDPVLSNFDLQLTPLDDGLRSYLAS